MLSSDKTENIRSFYKKKVVRIVIPLVSWNIIYFVYKYIMGYIVFDINVFMTNLLVNGNEYHLWFMYEMIGMYLIAPFLKILINNLSEKRQILLLFLMMLGTTIRPFFNTVTPIYLYFFEPLFNGYVSLLLMGYILSRTNIDKKKTIIFGVIAILCILTSIMLNQLSSSNENINLISNGGYSLCHYGLAAAIFVFSRVLFENTKEKQLVKIVSKYSFGIYLIHVIIIDLINNYFMIEGKPIICSVYVFLVSFVISIVAAILLGKIKYIKKIIQ